MKIVLINPDSTFGKANWACRRFFTSIAPLGLAYIAASLQKKGHRVTIFDQFAARLPDSSLLASLKNEQPDIVGFSVLTPAMPDVARLAPAVRAACPGARIVLGNTHASCFPRELLLDGTADLVVRGEGEATMVDLCRALSAGESLSTVQGISYLSAGAVMDNPDRPLIEDLDSLPLPAWELLDWELYRNSFIVAINNVRAAPIMASRGCDYRCYYCAQDKTFPRVRSRKMEAVVDEMEFFHRRYGIGHYGFCDANFPRSPEAGIEFCGLIRKRGLEKKVKWCTETRVDKVDRKLLGEMKASGCDLIMYGIEVGDEEILKSINKGTTLRQAEETVRMTRAAGIKMLGLYMLGLPGETRRTCRKTVEFAKKLDCDIVKFNLAVPFPGSRFYSERLASSGWRGCGDINAWSDWADPGAELSYCPEGMTSKELRGIQRGAMFEYYCRPRVILSRLFNGTITLGNLILGGIWLLRMLFARRRVPVREGAQD